MGKKVIQSLDNDLKGYGAIPVNDFVGLSGDVQGLTTQLADNVTDIKNIEVSITKYSDLVTNGDWSPAIIAAINDLSDYQTLAVPYGSYNFSQNIICTKLINIKCDGVLVFTGTGVAFTYGSDGVFTLNTDLKIRLKNNVLNWLVDTTGFRAYNIGSCHLDVDIQYFQKGLELIGSNGGCQYNTISLKTLYTNKESLRLVADTNGGWCNQNTIIGGRFGWQSGQDYTNAIHVNMVQNSSNMINNNNFYAVSFECADTVNRGGNAAVINGYHNAFYNCRYEGIKNITFGTNANYNFVEQGYELSSVVPIGLLSTSQNMINTRDVRNYIGASSTGSVNIFKNIYSNSSKSLSVQNTSGTETYSINGNGTVNSNSYGYFQSGVRFSTSDLTYNDRGIFIGTGSPEGVITARPGSIYLNVSGGTGATFYVKEQFTSSSGWIANDIPQIVNAHTDLAGALSLTNSGTKKILFIPDGTYSISSALTISGDNIEVRMAPNAKIVSTVSNINTFIFTGKNCSLNGGTIEYPSTFDGTNRKWEDYEAVVLIKGDGFKANNVTLNNVYKVGFGIRGASNCSIRGITLNGNYPASNWTGVETAHFGIAVDPSISGGGEDVIVSGNIIKSCVQGLFIGNYGSGVGYGINISTNVFDGCFNHGIYSNGGIGTIVNANSFKRCSLPIAILGNYSTVTSNNIYTSSTGDDLDLVGISVREATHCIVSNNIIKGDAPVGSTLIALENLSADPAPNNTIDNNIVSNNIIDTVNGSSTAIRIGNTSLTTVCKNNQVKNNVIKGNGRGASNGLIEVLSVSGNQGRNNQIIGNIISLINPCYAIYAYQQIGLITADNTIKFEYSAPSATTMTMFFSSGVTDSITRGNSIRCESTYGTNVTLRGIWEDGTCARNLVTNNLVNFDMTLLAAKTEIFVQATSKSASNMVAGAYVA